MHSPDGDHEALPHLQASAAGGGVYLRDTPVQLVDNMTMAASRGQTGAGLYAGERKAGMMVLQPTVDTSSHHEQVLIHSEPYTHPTTAIVHRYPTERASIGSISNSAFKNGVAAELGGGIALNSSVVGSLLYDTFLVGPAATCALSGSIP